ncbi:uncharacterized protein LOC108600026 isoform X1 [Drosophila busckii]|nr:uncharacterized protein LOC108600026 isoform X1 [Drosophila busckii]
MTIIKAADILDEPHLVAPWCYLNFLRYFQRRHPSYERERLLHEALRLWEQLSLTQRRLFEREQRILARIKRLGKLAPKRRGRRNIVKATATGQRRRTTVRRLIYDKRPAGSTLRKRRLNKKRA